MKLSKRLYNHQAKKPAFRKNPYKTAFLLFFSGLIFLQQACTPESCYEETNAFVKVSFYNNITGNRMAPDSLTIFGSGMDEMKLYDRTAAVQPALLPLNVTSGESIFVIRINGITDTVTINHNSYPHLVSKECGYSFFHNIDIPLWTNNIIDTIRISQSNITTANEENIRIYY
jgi:predicted nucleic-acid-binding Zn-ribbon protein